MRLSFEGFQIDVSGCELTCNGRPVALERRPTEVLCLLVTQAGDLLSRRVIADTVWGAASGVDADMGLNTAIRKIRAALGDTADAPRFIETVQGRGYRFIASTAPVVVGSCVTLAVLAFDNLTGAVEQDYVADGFTEEMIAALGALAPDRLRVLGRRSVSQFRSSTLGAVEIGQALGAAYLLESSVRREGAMLRITTRLIYATDGRQIWSATFDGEPSRMSQLQMQVSEAVAERMRATLSLHAVPPRAARHTRNEAAYDLYLRGRHCWNRNMSGMAQEAIGYFIRATEIAPSYALAWSGLADVYSSSPINSDVPALAVLQPARQAAEAALRSAPMLAEAHASLGFVRFWLDWDWHDAERLFRAAVALDPGYAFAHRMVGIASSHLGLHQEAAASIRRAVELDPLFAMHHALSAVIALQAGDGRRAASFARDAIDVDPHFWIGHLQLAMAMQHCGEPAAALTALEAAQRNCGNSSKPAMLRGYILARLGRTDEAQAVLAQLREAATQRFVPPFSMALIHLGLGETERALGQLARGVAERDVNLTFLPFDAKWNALRADHRFQAIIAACGFYRHAGASVGDDLPAPALQTVFRNAPWHDGRRPH